MAIDCGLSRHVGALFFQDRERDGTTPGSVRRIVSAFGDYYAVDKTSYDNAQAVKEMAYQLCGGRIDRVYLDPAATARSGVGPAAHGEFARALGERITEAWPVHRVLEGLDQVEILLGAPAPRAGSLDPSPVQVPHRQLQDLPPGRAARRGPRHAGRPPAPRRGGHRRPTGAVRTVFLEGRVEPAQFRQHDLQTGRYR